MLKYPMIKVCFAIIIAIMLTLDMYGFTFSKFWYALATGIFILLVSFGSSFIQWQFFLASSNKSNTAKHEIALTFDDGPDEKNTIRVLDALDKYNAKATFFCIGKKLNSLPSVAQEIVRRGHSLANHSFSHASYFPILSTAKIIVELEKTNTIIETIANTNNTLFRPPFGVTNPRIARAAKQMQMEVIGWSIRSYDTTGANIKNVIDRVDNQLKPGAIVLLHDDRNTTPEILEGILRSMQQKKLRSVKVEELLKL